MSYTLPVNTAAEEAFHAPMDYPEKASRRKTVCIVLLAIALAIEQAVIVKLAVAPKDAYFGVTMPNGEMYIISDPKKRITLQANTFAYDAVKQSLNSFAEAYFERTLVTAQKDYERARWFLPEEPYHLLASYEDAATGPGGWIQGLANHTIPESHARIDTIELRDEDIQQEPYQARAYITRTDLASGQVTHTIANITFTVDPAAVRKDKNGRYPYYNALGVFLVKPIQETVDNRR
jgi:hypothetical protein